MPEGGEGSVSPLGELDERILPCLLLMAGSVEHPIMSTACHNKAHRGHVSSLGQGFQVLMLRVVWKDRKDTKVYIQPNLSAKGNVQRQ